MNDVIGSDIETWRGRWIEDGLEMNGRLNSIVQRKIIGYIKLFMSYNNIF